MKYLVLFASLFLFCGFGFGQSLPIDFESGVMAGDFVTFGTTVTDDANPDNSGVNPSANVARIIKTGGNGGCFVDLASPLDFAANGDQLCIKVYSESSNPTVILFKLEGSGNTERQMTWTPSSDWQEMCFDFSGDFAPYTKITLFFGFNGSAAQNFLFDDIVHPPRLDGKELALDIDFEGNDFAGNPIDSDNLGPLGLGHLGANGFNGGAATVIPNPNITTEGNPSATVAQIIRHSGTEAGASIDLPEDLVLDIDPILCMNVFTEAAVGTEVTLRIEDSNDASLFMESVAVTTVSGAWDTLCFVYHSAPQDCPTCDRLSFLFDYGPGGLMTGNGDPEEDTFLFDDIYQPLSNLSLGIFFTPGSQFFCPPSSFTFTFPENGNYKWFNDAGDLVGTGPNYTTQVLSGTTAFFVQDTSTVTISQTDVGPSNQAGKLFIPGTASTFLSSNIANGAWYGVDLVQTIIGAPGPNCTYNVVGRNLTLGINENLVQVFSNFPSAPDNVRREFVFSNPLPLNAGDAMELQVSVVGNGCFLSSYFGYSNLAAPTTYPVTTAGGEIIFTGYQVPADPGLENDRWMGFDYQVSGDVLTDPTIYQVNAIADCANPLPIELLDFSVHDHNGDALLKWSTASELNNDRFLLLRTVDGINYETVGIVSGAGNSSTVLNYTFLDRDPLKGLSYYKLTQVDFDGTESSSELVSFLNEANEGFRLFPNPTNQHLTLSFNEDYERIEVLVSALAVAWSITCPFHRSRK